MFSFIILHYKNIDETLENLHSHNSEIFESLIKQNLRDKMGVMEDD